MPGKDKSESTSTVNGAADQPAFSLIAREKLLQIYTTMVKCRILEERLGMFAQRDASGSGKAAAREATLVGATVDLGRGDAIVPDRWQILAGLANGTVPQRTLKLLSNGAGSRRSVKVPAELPFEVAIRAAQIRKQKRSRKIVVALADVEQASAPAWRKALALAVRQKLPIVCVLQGRGPATVAGEATEAGAEARPRVAVKGLPAIVVDGDDAIAVYRVAYEAIARARRGLGPTLIECEPYFVENEAKSRKAGPQRPPAPEAAHRSDSIANMEAYLRGKGLFIAQARRRIAADFAAELDRFGDARFRG